MIAIIQEKFFDTIEKYRRKKHVKKLKLVIDNYYFSEDNNLSTITKINIWSKFTKKHTDLKNQLEKEYGKSYSYLPFSYLKMRMDHIESEFNATKKLVSKK